MNIQYEKHMIYQCQLAILSIIVGDEHRKFEYRLWLGYSPFKFSLLVPEWWQR